MTERLETVLEKISTVPNLIDSSVGTRNFINSW